MKNKLVWMSSIIILLTLASCGRTSDNTTPQNQPSELSGTLPIVAASESGVDTDSGLSDAPEQSESGENNMTNISITVGDSVFTAKLYDNETARDFAAKLPMTLNMSELNGNEKFYYLPERLPNKSERVENIHTGDLMLYGSDCLVLFYKNFSTPYSYTRFGYIEDVSGLASALGSGSAEVTFAVSD